MALVDKGDRHHNAVRELYDERPEAWLLPWAILPEVDYLVGSQLGVRAQEAFLEDVAEGSFTSSTESTWMSFAPTRSPGRYRALGLGLVDAVVIAIAERVRADGRDTRS